MPVAWKKRSRNAAAAPFDAVAMNAVAGAGAPW